MAGNELERFYKCDNHRYELNKNKNYIEWYKYLKKQGYIPLLSINELQKLIDHVALWYEKKYPDKNFNLPYESSIFELFSTLSKKESSLLNGDYRGYGFERIKNEDIISLTIYYLMEGNFKKPCSIIKFKKNGELVDNQLSFDSFNDKELEINIDEKNKDIKSLYQELSKYKKEFDLHELEETIYNNYCDSLLRKYTLRLVPLRLLYSPTTTYCNGYMRANKFVDDFNRYYSSKDINLELTTTEIEIIIDSITKEQEKVLKK